MSDADLGAGSDADEPSRPPARSRCWPSSAAPTSASPRWSTGSSAAARRSSRTCPGVTRDRVSYDATWAGRAFTVVDTGGWDPDARGLAARITAQAEIAVDAGRRGAVRGRRDRRHHRRRRGRRPGAARVREAGDPGRQQGRRPARRGRGLRAVEPRPGRALPGLGPARPRLRRPARRHPRRAARAPPEQSFEEDGGPRRVAIVGKPNVGKSSLLNKLAGAERVVVDSVAGTTVDPVDELVELGGRDVAVHRHRRHPQAGQGGLRATSSTPRCAPRPRSTGPRSPCWCSTPTSRSPSRTCGSSRPSARPAARW